VRFPVYTHEGVMMILHRTVFQAKIGKADNVVAIMKEAFNIIPEEQLQALQPRILTDISGAFDTVIVESTHESLATYEQFRTMLLARNNEDGATSGMTDLIESGRNEYYTIEY